jgi:hypothetical protein
MLRFSGADPHLSDADWQAALAYCDRMQLTLLLPRDRMPEWVRTRVLHDLEKNRERLRRLKAAMSEIACIPAIVLKGVTTWGTYVAEPETRVQYDIDLYSPEPAAAAAALADLGYHAEPQERLPTDHLPRMTRVSGYKWSGDFFDPEIPLAVEVHFRWWDEATEGFAAPGVEQFWDRRLPNALGPADGLAYAALHLLRHLLRGDVRTSHVYELAYFLHGHADDDRFWQTWMALHTTELRRLQAICFRLASEWFDCRLHAAAREEIAGLPLPVARWFEHYGASPLTAFFHPNKDELGLHWCLLDGIGARIRVTRRRLLPIRGRYTWSRALFHVRTLGPALSMMFRMPRW